MTNKPLDRRTVLKTSAGLLGTLGLTQTVAASPPPGEKPYGNGNGIGAFLNEEAKFKETPIFTGEIADKRGQEVVDIAVGAMTSVDPPEEVEAPPKLPVAFDPLAVRISPGATVRWTWVPHPLPPEAEGPIPHDVKSLVDEDGEVVVKPHADVKFHSGFKQFTDPDPTFEVTFGDRGNHLYYCTPHGAPYAHHGHSENVLGMRGAVQVAGKPL